MNPNVGGHEVDEHLLVLLRNHVCIMEKFWHGCYLMKVSPKDKNKDHEGRRQRLLEKAPKLEQVEYLVNQLEDLWVCL